MNIKEKCEKLLRYKYEYYLGTPTILDSDYDIFEKNLRDTGDPLALKVVDMVDFPSIREIEELGLNLDNICPILKIKNSEKIPHLTKMLSIQKVQCNDEDNLPYHDIELFMNRVKCDYWETSLKYDGNSIELIYENSDLKLALSRGDGKVGLDKTPKMKLIVPNNIPLNGTIEIRGEILIDKKTFREKYATQGTIENERNIVAGFMNAEDVDIKIMNDLTFVAYSIVEIKNGNSIYIENAMDVLSEIGFNKKYKPEIHYFSKIEEFDDIYKKFKELKEKSPFLIDGFVIKTQEKYRGKLSDNGHYWKWCLACKFKSEEVSTKIVDIIWTVSSDGEYHAVAILSPVVLLDTVVTRTSLGNLSNIFKSGSYPGSVVSIKKSGDIIPFITSVLQKSDEHDLYEKYVLDFIKSCTK